jgi:hypothetical protein
MAIWICFPFLIRFNPWTVFDKRNYASHQDLLTYRRILLFLQLVALHYFVYATLLPILQRPKAYSLHTFKSPGDVPVVDQSRAFDMPSVCLTEFTGLSVVQYAGLAETGYDVVFGPEAIEQQLNLSFGHEWNQMLEIVSIQRTDFSVFGHFRRLDENVDV